MIDTQALGKLVEDALAGTEYYLTSLTVGAGNEIAVEIDSDGPVDLDICIKLNRLINDSFDRDVEDYEVEVGSAGITSPLKVPRQFVKNLGRRVSVLTADGRKLRGLLSEAGDDGFSLETAVKKKPEGAKRPVEVTETLRFAYPEVKSVTCEIDF